MLPLRRALAEPAVIGKIQEKVCLRIDIFARVMRKGVLKTDQHRGLHVEVAHVECGHALARRELALYLGEFLEKRQPPAQWHVLAENY